MEQALRAIIKAVSPDTKVEWGWSSVSESLDYPLVTLVLGSQRFEYTHSGASNLIRSRVQIDIWGRTFAESVAIRNAIVPVLNGVRPTGSILKPIFIDGIRGDRSDDMARQTIDAIVWHH